MSNAAASTPTDSALAERARLERALRAHGTGYDFVQMVRLLMRLHPERAPVGGWDDPADEVVRFTVPPSLAFPPSQIAKLTLPAHGAAEPAQMAVRFFGLTGPQGVLPHVYTEHAAVRSRVRDTAFRDFLDLFHHRTLSLFYRAWERYRTTVAAERGEEDRLRSHLLDFAGAGTEDTRRRSQIDADTLAYYAGLLALRSRPAEGLAQLVADAFRVAASVEQFVGEWRPLQSGGQLALDDDGPDGQLGAAVIGNAVYDPHARVRLRLGPMTRAQFDRFLPGGESHEPLRKLARLYADDQVGVEVQLVLAKNEVPQAQLGASGAPRLGLGTWLRSQPASRDADDVHLALC